MFGLIPWKRSSQPELSRQPQWVDPWESSLSRLREEMDRLFERFLGTELQSEEKTSKLFPWQGWFEGLQDQGDHYLVRLPAPGFEPEEFDVSLSGNRLVIRAEHKEEQKEEGNGGFRYGSIHQVITLPEGVDPQRIEARYHNGVLEVQVPKSEEARPKRIPVKS